MRGGRDSQGKSRPPILDEYALSQKRQAIEQVKGNNILLHDLCDPIDDVAMRGWVYCAHVAIQRVASGDHFWPRPHISAAGLHEPGTPLGCKLSKGFPLLLGGQPLLPAAGVQHSLLQYGHEVGGFHPRAGPAEIRLLGGQIGQR